MSSVSDITSLNGLFKKVYSDYMEKLIPTQLEILPMIDFIPSEKMGGLLYSVPVIVQRSHGVTYGGEGGDAFALNVPIASVVKQAEVRGNEIVLRDYLSIGAASRSMKSEGAFIQNTKYLVENMTESIHSKLEAEALYGQMGLGTVASFSVNTVTVTTAEWASGLWSGSEGMKVDFYSTSTLIGTASIASVSIENRTLTFDLLPAGVLAGQTMFEHGAFGKEFAGIHKILTNTGTLFNISASQYTLWKSAEYDNGATALSFPKLDEAIAVAVGKGLNKDIKLFVNPRTWSDLTQDNLSKRMFDVSYKDSEAKTGSRKIKYYSQNGEVEIIPHNMVKEGYAYGLVMADFEKVGSTDVTFKIPGRNDEFFKLVDNVNGYEMRCYADFALFCRKPARQFLIKNISN